MLPGGTQFVLEMWTKWMESGTEVKARRKNCCSLKLMMTVMDPYPRWKHVNKSTKKLNGLLLNKSDFKNINMDRYEGGDHILLYPIPMSGYLQRSWANAFSAMCPQCSAISSKSALSKCGVPLVLWLFSLSFLWCCSLLGCSVPELFEEDASGLLCSLIGAFLFPTMSCSADWSFKVGMS